MDNHPYLASTFNPLKTLLVKPLKSRKSAKSSKNRQMKYYINEQLEDFKIYNF